MLKLCTCYQCGFPFKSDNEELPPECPSCGGSPDNFLFEPYNEQEIRRIHVDPPLPVTGRDPMNLDWHMPKQFLQHNRNGRMRRFVMEYDDPNESRKFYEDVFGWDIITTEYASEERPLMYCATGPGTAGWEPSVVSFAYGFLKDRATVDTTAHPMFCIEVTSIEDAVTLVEQNGGRLLKPPYHEDSNRYAVVEDSEGNGLYLWQTPDTVA